MPGWRPAPLAIAVAATLAGVPVRAGGAEALRISGTGTGLGTIRQLASAFEQALPGQPVKLLPSVGSAGAIQAVADGALDIGLSGRPLQPEEQERGLLALAYARTPFLFAVGPRVGISGITAAGLARLYRGEETRWPDGERIRLVLRPRSDVDTGLVRAIAPEIDAAMELALGREGMILAATNQDCDQAIARTPGSIGPSSLTQLLTDSFAPRSIAWNGVAPTLENLASGAYPLEKRLFLVVRAAPPPAARRFMAFLGTPAARRILEQTGNLPVALPPIP
jgi:phosphate transport system substrate-binding protein